MPDKWISLACTINLTNIMCNFLDFLFENIEINTVEQNDNNNINNKHI